MSVRLVKGSLTMADMKDGQIAIITTGKYKDRIIQYCCTFDHHYWIPIGDRFEKGFGIIKTKDKIKMSHPVRLLEEGECLIIENNDKS